MILNPYLTFNGNCEAALNFYQQHLGGKILMLLPHAGTPASEHVPADWASKVLHATIDIAGTVVMASDAPPDRYGKPGGFMLSLSVTSVDEAQRLYDALADGGEIGMPLAETFWAERFAMLTDQFGTPWIINYDGKYAPPS